MSKTPKGPRRHAPMAPPPAEPTVEPTPRRLDEDDERLVPTTNVGGATPTALGGNSGGSLPGPDDDLSNLAEPEPPEPAEATSTGIRHFASERGPRE